MAAGGAGGGRTSAAAGCRAAQSPEAGARSGPHPRSLRPSPPRRRAGGRAEWPLRCGLVLGPQLGVLGVTPGASRPPPPEARFGSVSGRHRAGAASGSGASGERVSARRGGGTQGAGAGVGSRVLGSGYGSGVQERGAGREVVGPRGPWEAREKKRSATLIWGGGGGEQQFQGFCFRTPRVNDTDMCSLRVQDLPELLQAWQVGDWAAGPQPPTPSSEG